MVTLFKTDKTGRMRFYTVHDLQRSLWGGFALTVSQSVGDAAGSDTWVRFENAFEGSSWLNRTLSQKKRGGYRVLYSYGFVRTHLEGDETPLRRSAG